MSHNDMFRVGGPKTINLLTLAGTPILLLGEYHHNRADGMTVVHLIRQLMDCAETTRLFIETASINSKRHRTDKASNQVVRTGCTYTNGRTWAVDLKKFSRAFNVSMFRSASANLQPLNNKKMMRIVRQKMCKLIQFIYEAVDDRVRREAFAHTLFRGVPNASHFIRHCIKRFATIPNRMHGDMRPLFDEYIKTGHLGGRTRNGSNELEVDNFEGARVIAVALINDLYTCDLMLAMQSPGIFYGGSTHCAHISFLLNNCYTIDCQALYTEAADDGYATEVHLSKAQHDLLLAVFCAHRLR